MIKLVVLKHVKCKCSTSLKKIVCSMWMWYPCTTPDSTYIYIFLKWWRIEDWQLLKCKRQMSEIFCSCVLIYFYQKVLEYQTDCIKIKNPSGVKNITSFPLLKIGI